MPQSKLLDSLKKLKQLQNAHSNVSPGRTLRKVALPKITNFDVEQSLKRSIPEVILRYFYSLTLFQHNSIQYLNLG